MDSLDDVIRRSGADAYVAFGSSQNADIRYLTRFRTEDPFVYIKKPGEMGVIVIGQMEYERAMRESIAAVMTRGESGLLDIIKEEPVRHRAYAKMIAQHAGPHILVPASFPYGIGHELESFCKVTLDPGSVETARAIKSDNEISQIRNVQAATDIAMERAVSLIKASNPIKGVLYHDSRPVTSELVRSLVHKTLMDHGCHAIDTIVTCGKDTALPHALGSGPLMESEPIVIDTFPADDMSGYFTDMTRTVIRGEPSPELLEMYNAVREAQDLGMALVTHGASGSSVHQAVVDLFAEKGYGTDTSGFTHNLGHGVGLEVHELPTLGPAGGTLAAGNVVTVEPGLYYRDIGGVRLENTGAVTTAGFDSFTQFPREFILR
jgi:Xaa-Pro aminopeptidase